MQLRENIWYGCDVYDGMMHYFTRRQNKVVYIDQEGDCSGIFESDYLLEPIMTHMSDPVGFKQEALKYISEQEYQLFMYGQPSGDEFTEITFEELRKLFVGDDDDDELF